MMYNRTRAPLSRRGFYGLYTARGRKELKVIDTASASYAADTTGLVTLINGVAQGTDFNTRIGRKFTMKSVLVRGDVRVGATPASTAWRVMVVLDRQANGVAPGITDIINAANLAGVQTLSFRDRFVVLMDKQGWLEQTDMQIRPFKWYHKCNLEVTNSGTGATVGSIATGALYLVTCGATGAGVTAAIVQVACRVRFTDE